MDDSNPSAGAAPSAPASDPPRRAAVLVFDSGLGGLTVLREIARIRPDVDLLYVADDAAFPYGRLNDAALVERVVTVMRHFIGVLQPTLAVIACNTASTLTLPVLRKRFSIPFVGTVPAIKPACAQSRTKQISVLATPATVARDYTRDLIREFAADCTVTLVGAVRLASLVEFTMRGEPVTDESIKAEIAPCFVTGTARTDAVVLACTHYPIILDRLERLAPWPVRWIDPASAIARRVSEVLGPAGEPAGTVPQAYFTSGDPPSPALLRSLVGFGVTLDEAKPSRLPV